MGEFVICICRQAFFVCSIAQHGWVGMQASLDARRWPPRQLGVAHTTPPGGTRAIMPAATWWRRHESFDAILLPMLPFPGRAPCTALRKGQCSSGQFHVSGAARCVSRKEEASFRGRPRLQPGGHLWRPVESPSQGKGGGGPGQAASPSCKHTMASLLASNSWLASLIAVGPAIRPGILVYPCKLLILPSGCMYGSVYGLCVWHTMHAGIFLIANARPDDRPSIHTSARRPGHTHGGGHLAGIFPSSLPVFFVVLCKVSFVSAVYASGTWGIAHTNQ